MEKIGAKETKWLLILLMLSTVTLGDIAVFVSNSGTAAFINCICGLLIALLATLVVNLLIRHTDMFEVFTAVYGKALTSILGFVLLAVTLMNGAQKMELFSRAISEFVLTDTPRIFILILFSVSVLSAVLFNLEAITRYALAAGLVFLVFAGIIVFASLSEARYTNICPVLGKGRIVNVLNMLYVFGDVVYFYIISGYIRNRRRSAFTASKAVIGAGVITAVLTLFYTLCVPYPVSEKYTYPLYRLASLANYTVVLQRLDGLVFLMWMFLGFISVSALTLFAVIIFARLFNLSDPRAVSPAFVFLVFLITLTGFVSEKAVNVILPAFAFGVMPLTAVLYKFKKSWRKKND